jgi:PAS domain S-box-containing protein
MENLLHRLPSLASMVNRTPAIADPEMPLSEAIYMMSQNQGNLCLLPELDPSETSSIEAHIQRIAQAHSAVLVLEQNCLVGIFTEQDLVRLSAIQTDLRGVKIGAVMTRNPRTLLFSEGETVISALSLLEQYKIRHLPIVDDRAQLVGTISSHAIRQILQPIDLLKFRSVRDGMTVDVVQVTADSTVLEITQLMVAHQVSSVVIVEAGLPVGIITEQDIVQFQLLELNFNRLSARAVMSAPLFCLRPEDSLWMAQQMMETKLIRRLVVIDAQGELCGIVTQSNLLKSLDPLEMLRVVGSLQAQLLERASELEQTNGELRSEIDRRQQVEDRLRRASVSLEERMGLRMAELRQNERKFRAIFNGAFGFVGLLTVDGIVLEANHTAMSAMGPENNIIGQPFVSTVWWSHSPSLQLRLKEAIDRAAAGERVRFESNHNLADGSNIIADFSISPIFDGTGKVVMLIPEGRDITELKAGEQQIREQAAMLNIATDAIIVRDLIDFTIEFWNNGAELIYGWSSEEVTGLKTTVELFQKYPDQVDMAALAGVLEQGIWQGELCKLTKSGKEVIVESRCSLVRDATGNPKSILSVETDITAKKQLEQQFFRVQRLESLGTLASGIAHDLNNILTPILGIAQLLPLTLPTVDDRNQKLLEVLAGSAKRGGSLVKQILTFAKGIDGKPMLLQVRHILAEVISVARQTFPKSIDVLLDLDSEDLWMVYVDATQIHQVLMNLFVNARDAMPMGGLITATARNVVLDDSYTRLHPEVSVGAHILMTIADTGIGMDSGTVDRIFDSFFTTKEAGTGLGLSTVMGIVKAHGGFITVESVLGQGSAFNVYIPAIKAISDDLLDSVPESFDGKGQLVLVVDDEIAIREITRDALELYNYHTMLANDGVEALVLYAQNWQRIGVVMVDMMMPHLNTPSVIQALQQINPAVKIIVMSGSAANEGIVEQYGLNAFLTKPFTTIEMMRALA